METANFNSAGDVPYLRAPQSRPRRPGTRKLLKKEKRKSWEEGLLMRKVGIKYAPPRWGYPDLGIKRAHTLMEQPVYRTVFWGK